MSADRRAELLREARETRLRWIEDAAGPAGPADAAGGPAPEPPAAKREAPEPPPVPQLAEVARFLETVGGGGGGDELERSAFVPDDLGEGVDDCSSSSSSSSEVGGGFDAFVALLKRPESVDVVKSLEQFVGAFGQCDLAARLADDTPSADRPGAMVQSFVARLEAQLDGQRAWRAAAGAAELQECIEKFVMGKLYAAAFAPLPADRARDAELHARIASLQFLRFEHLDLKALRDEGGLWGRACDELRAMDAVRAPQDKLECVLRCCRTLTELLRNATADGSLPGADDFLPALIMVVLQANPDRLHSNVRYMAEYRSPAALMSEGGYYLTNLESALMFLDTVDSSSLTITAEEFEAGLSASAVPSAPAPAPAAADEEPAPSSRPRLGSAPVELEPPPSVLQVRAARIATTGGLPPVAALPPVLPGAAAPRRDVYRFEGADAEDLTMADVRELLASYKMLAVATRKMLKKQRRMSGRAPG